MTTRVRTIVPRYKKGSGKKADVMTFNYEHLAYDKDDKDRTRAPKRTVEPFTITPSGTEVPDDVANWMDALSNRVEIVKDAPDFSVMNKDSLVAEGVRMDVELDMRMTKTKMIDKLKAFFSPSVEDEDEDGGDDDPTKPDGNPPE